MHVKVLKVMSVPTYSLEMHFNFTKGVLIYQTDYNPSDLPKSFKIKNG